MLRHEQPAKNHVRGDASGLEANVPGVEAQRRLDTCRTRLQMPHHAIDTFVIPKSEPGSARSCFIALIFYVPLALCLGCYYWRPLTGLPIDDSYIFIQYAKNLAAHADLSFNAGDRSFGITSFAWTMLLAGTHWILRGDLINEAQILGALLLGITASFWTGTFRHLGGGRVLSSLVGIALVTNPFLLGHSISGMESALNLAVLSLLAWCISIPAGPSGVAAGTLMGLSYLTRPDNLVLLPVCLMATLIAAPAAARSMRDRLAEWIPVCASFAIIVIPFCAWSYFRVGSVIPPTRIGKLLVFLPESYGITLAQFNSLGLEGHVSVALSCVTHRILPMFTTECERTVLPIVFIGICSLPLLMFTRGPHRVLCILLSLYSIGLVSSYALFFPLVKDRHLSNLHSVAIAGFGMLALYVGQRSSAIRPRQMGRWSDAAFMPAPFTAVGLLCLSIVGSLAFLPHYRAEYMRRVANINVWCGTGQWLGSHTPVEAKVALEPMGAIKYCSHRYVLDMGGLATRKTWPSISQGQGGGLDSIDHLLRSEQIDFVVDHHPSEWIGRLAVEYPEDYHLVAHVEPSSRDREFGATDTFDVFATQWGVGPGEPKTAGQRMH